MFKKSIGILGTMALSLLVLKGLPAQTLSRTEQQAAFQIRLSKTADPITVDGQFSEQTWQSAEKTQPFWLKWPRDGAPAPQQTEVRAAFDERYLYFAVTAFDTTPNHVIQSLKRDVGYWDSDGFAVILDPANTAVNGYFFGISANGVQTESLLSTGSEDMDTNWDNAWVVKTQQYPDRWTAEYAIPLRILRFREGLDTWGVNFIRNDLTNGLYSVWARIPFQFDGLDLGWTGAMKWSEAPKKVKKNYNIIPYITGGLSRDFEKGTDVLKSGNVGLDAKIGIGSGLNLDLTINPDFSQIEIDEQLVNLTRFDLQLPEKRTFFLENGDLFSNFGIPPVRPFFSRAIGLDKEGVPLPILGGLRVTGNVSADTRVGALSMATGKSGNTPARQYSAFAGSHRMFGRSKISGYFLDLETYDQQGRLQARQFSRNAGVEFSYISLNGLWSAWATHHASFKPDIKKQNAWGNAGFQYRKRGFYWLSDLAKMGRNYYADMGFEARIENYDPVKDTTLRIGYQFWFNRLGYQIFPKKQASKLNYIEISGELFNVFNPDMSWNESSNFIGMELNFKNTASLNLKFSPNRANVPVPFKFDDEDDLEKCPALPAGVYAFNTGEIKWSSDYRKPVFYSLTLGGGTFYEGIQEQAAAELTCRFQPFMNLILRAQFTRLDFSSPYCDVDILNITPRIEIFFAKNIWWTTFLQYNTQADNFNINSRFQWRFRPMSDLFVVYTDNYQAETLKGKNRALSAKMSWWF